MPRNPAARCAGDDSIKVATVIGRSALRLVKIAALRACKRHAQNGFIRRPDDFIHPQSRNTASCGIALASAIKFNRVPDARRAGACGDHQRDVGNARRSNLHEILTPPQVPMPGNAKRAVAADDVAMPSGCLIPATSHGRPTIQVIQIAQLDALRQILNRSHLDTRVTRALMSCHRRRCRRVLAGIPDDGVRGTACPK